MTQRQAPLFIHSRFRSHLGRSPFGEWLLNPDVLRIRFDADPNTGRGLDADQLKALIKELSTLHKRLSSEVTRRGRKPYTGIGRCVDLFLKHYSAELDIKTVWARVRADLRKGKHADQEADWEKLRNSAKRRMKREGSYPIGKPKDSV